MQFVCHSYALVCYSSVTRIYFYVICIPLICGIAMNYFNDLNVLEEEKLYEIIFNLDFNTKRVLSRSSLQLLPLFSEQQLLLSTKTLKPM